MFLSWKKDWGDIQLGGHSSCPRRECRGRVFMGVRDTGGKKWPLELFRASYICFLSDLLPDFILVYSDIFIVMNSFSSPSPFLPEHSLPSKVPFYPNTQQNPLQCFQREGLLLGSLSSSRSLLSCASHAGPSTMFILPWELQPDFSHLPALFSPYETKSQRPPKW